MGWKIDIPNLSEVVVVTEVKIEDLESGVGLEVLALFKDVAGQYFSLTLIPSELYTVEGDREARQAIRQFIERLDDAANIEQV